MPESKYEKGQLYHIPCADLQSDPSQPRKFFDEEPLNDLAASVKDHGLLQPVLFRQHDDGKLFIVAGERRLKAAIKSGLQTISAILVEGKHTEIALVENILRQDLTAIELAEALNKVKRDHGYSDKQLTTIIGKAKSTVSEILSLIQLPQEIRDECREDPKISRQVLIDIAKKKTAKGMKTAFEKYKAQKEAKQKSEKQIRQSKTLSGKVKSMNSDLNHILNHQSFEALDTAERNDLVTSLEELKKMADSLIERIKTTSVGQSKPAVTPGSKRIDVSAVKAHSAKKTEPSVKAKNERIEIGERKPQK